ncbi:MAG: hypothetical protein JW864_13830 [Spirochaetes bacterium]|nr:hypothetical protein [Spirochaetota bacterium]
MINCNRKLPLTGLLFIIALSCASKDIYINKSDIRNVKKILIADFEKRFMKYDPYIAENFRDAIRFEFIKLGFKVESLPLIAETSESDNDIKNSTEKNVTKKTAGKFINDSKSDLIIYGVISEKDYGDAIDTDISTSIVLHLYNKYGKKIGEARYICSDTLEDAMVIKKISSNLASMIIENLD